MRMNEVEAREFDAQIVEINDIAEKVRKLVALLDSDADGHRMTALKNALGDLRAALPPEPEPEQPEG